MDEMVVWDPDLELGGLTPAQIKGAHPVVEGPLLGAIRCSRSRTSTPSAPSTRKARSSPTRNAISRSAPPSDYVGSTEYIVKTIKEAPGGTRWLVGTELNLVDRLAEEVKPQDKIVQFMATTICMCSTMQRIDPQHLAWTLENLAEGKVVNQIKVPEHETAAAKLALDRMLDIS